MGTALACNSWTRRPPKFAAATTALIATLVLIGWTFDLDLLKRCVPGLVAMNPMSAVAFLLCALSIALFADAKSGAQTPVRLWLARASALPVTLIGSAKLVELFGGPRAGIDQWLFSSKLAAELGRPNVMAPNTAFNFFLTGVALLLLYSRSRRLSAWACVCALISGFEALLAVLGYVYGVRAFSQMASFIPMALHTAIGFLLIAFAIMSCQGRRGLLAIITGDNVGGTVARRLLPAAILVPAGIGWLWLEGQRAGFFDNEFGTALYTVTNMLVFALLVAGNAHLLFKTDIERTRAEVRLRRAHDALEDHVQERTEQLSAANAELLKAHTELEGRVRERTASLALSEERYRLLFESNPYPVWLYDVETLSFLAANEAAVQRYGYSHEEFLLMTIKDIRPAKDIPVFLDDLSKRSADFVTAATWQHRRKDGSIMDVEVTSRALSFGGKPARLVIVNDITARKRAEEIARESKRQLEAATHANQLIMDNSRDVICTLDEQGRFVTVSAASETLWGYKPEELVGRCYIDMVHADDRDKTNRIAGEIVAGDAVSDFENRYIRKDGSFINVMWSSYWSEADKLMFAVAHDITRRARTEKALQQAKEEADCANRAKSEFLSRMSHELRTPMNAILGFAQLLELDELSQDQREGVDHILQGGRHLLDLINEVLDLARIEAGRMSLSLEPVEISEALRESIDLIRPLAKEREVQLIAPPVSDHYLVADRQRLKQVLLNLLSNSIKYNRPRGSVTLRCEVNDGRGRVYVTDTGRGIPADRLAKLFTPFERLGAEQSAIEGTGLGLAVAKRLIEAMDGALGVESVPGEGTTFWIELPLAESPLVRPELADESFHTQPLGAGEKRTVLYIEDNLPNFRLVERVLLRRPGIELLAARDGAEGLQLAREHLPDLILLDLNLPDMAGQEVLARLQSDPRCLAIPILVVSADATTRQRERVIEAGAADYLTKPINIKKFLEILDRTMVGAKQVS